MTREVREALERLRPALGRGTETLWASYLAADMDGRRELEAQLLLMDMARNRTGPGQGPPPLPPPEPGVLAGWLRLGEVTYPNRPPSPFGLNKGELIQHVGIFGRSGAGKTNTVLCLLRELLDKNVPFLIFDWKRNYRDLLAAPWVPEGKVRPVTVGRDLAPLHLNPLRPPPGTDPRTWLKKLIEITAHAYFLGEGVMYLLQEAIDTCYEKAGVYRGSDTYPTFRDVHKELLTRKVTGREANWMASTLRTTASLTYGPMGETICTGNPTDVRSLLQGNVILELDALTDSDKVFLVEAILLSIHHQRLAEGDREQLKHVILVEEAHHVFLRSKQELTGGEPITDVILREIRELGEAVVLVDQHPSQMAITALGNTYCTIAMNLKHRLDVNTIADACLLDLEQREHLGRLPVGAAIVKLQDRWTSPFLVRFPKVEITKGEVSDGLLALLTLPYKLPSLDRPRLCPIAAIPAPTVKTSPVPPSSVPPKGALVELSGPARRLLADVVAEPSSGVTQRYSRLGLSRREGTALKETLVRDEIVREVFVSLPGGRVTLLEPTDEGWRILGQAGPPARHGGPVHRFWMARIKEHLEAEGFEVAVEAPQDEGRTLDLTAQRDDALVAVEVEVSGRRLEASLEKLQASRASRRLLACADKSVLERAKELMARSSSPTTIETVHVWSFLTTKREP
jgi:hypothetical protein